MKKNSFVDALNRLTKEQKLAAFKKAIAEMPAATVDEPVSTEPKFNYCVGAYWEKNIFSDGKAIGTYTYHNDVFYGTMTEAEEFLAYVKRQSPEKDWQIFTIVPVDS
jgi:hypothetical protein